MKASNYSVYQKKLSKLYLILKEVKRKNIIWC